MRIRVPERLDDAIQTYLFALVVILAAGIFSMATVALAQQPKAYELTENQKLRLQIKQKDAQLAQLQLSIAQSAFSKTVEEFNAEAKAIEKENSWPETLQINPQTLTFSEAPAPPKPPDTGSPAPTPPAK